MCNISRCGDIRYRTETRLVGAQTSPCTLHNGGGNAASDNLLETKGGLEDNTQRRWHFGNVCDENANSERKIADNHNRNNDLGYRGKATDTAE